MGIEKIGLDEILLFDAYVQIVDQHVGQDMKHCAEALGCTPNELTRMFDAIEVALDILVVPRRLHHSGRIVTTRGEAPTPVVGSRHFRRKAGLTPDGQTFAMFAATVYGSFAVAKNLMRAPATPVRTFGFSSRPIKRNADLRTVFSDSSGAVRSLGAAVDRDPELTAERAAELLRETPKRRKLTAGLRALGSKEAPSPMKHEQQPEPDEVPVRRCGSKSKVDPA